MEALAAPLDARIDASGVPIPLWPRQDSETCMNAPLKRPDAANPRLSLVSKSSSMLFKFIKRGDVNEPQRSKFAVDAGFHKLDAAVPEFSEAQSSVETRNSEADSAYRDVQELYSNLTYLSTVQDSDEHAAAMAAEASAAAPSCDDTRSFALPEQVVRQVHVPVVSIVDPNLSLEDSRLEPIQLVVSEYSRTLNDAFFPPDEEFESEASFEQVVTRRGKWRRALRKIGVGRKENQGN